MKTIEELAKQKAEWFQKNKERIKDQKAAYAKIWFQKNKQAIYERRKDYFKQWREKNKGKWNEYGAKWYAENKERKRDVGYEWNKKNPEKIREIRRLYKQENRVRIAQEQRTRLLKYKRLIVEAYGGGCSCCGEKRITMLTVEHVNKNGRQHRQVGGNFYYYLVRKCFPKDEGLTILCMNCNWSERNGQPCEHKLEKSVSTSAEPEKVS